MTTTKLPLVGWSKFLNWTEGSSSKGVKQLLNNERRKMRWKAPSLVCFWLSYVFSCPVLGRMLAWQLARFWWFSFCMPTFFQALDRKHHSTKNRCDSAFHFIFQHFLQLNCQMSFCSSIKGIITLKMFRLCFCPNKLHFLNLLSVWI